MTAAKFYDRLGPEGYGLVIRLAEWRGPDDMAYVLKSVNAPLAGAHVVDVACGTGQLSPLFKKAGVASIVGVDASAENINHCLNGGLVDDGYVWDVAECGLPLNDAEAGVLTCSGLFSYLADPSFVAQDMARVLKKGGILAVNVHPARKSCVEIENLPAGSLGRQAAVVEMYHHPLSSVMDMFANAGLAPVRTHINNNGIMRLHTGKRLPLATLAFVKK